MKQLSGMQKWFLVIISLIVVGFGQPAWSWFSGLVAAVLGYALFWRVLLAEKKSSQRFWMAAGWYTGVQIIQLSWMASHPYAYIYGVLLTLSFLASLQFGLLSLFIRPSLFSSLWRLSGLAAFWTLMEWSRLFFLSGFSWNPAGLAITGTLYPLQAVALAGIFGLSFWVVWVNLLTLKAWMAPNKIKPALLCLCCAGAPYLFGVLHFYYHKQAMEQYQEEPLSVLLVQPSFPVEEAMDFRDAEELREYIIAEWRQILSIIKISFKQGKVDLIVLPEYVVPYGTYFPVFRVDEVHAAFKEVLELSDFKSFPPLEKPLADTVETVYGSMPLVSNAYWAQAIANLFNSDLIVGLEDVVYGEGGKRKCFNAALYFKPGRREIQRYEKRILVPMGEYIPLEICRKIAAKYGITGSFTCGKSAKVFNGKVPLSPSICYEETFGDLMRESRVLGGRVFVNITSDAWYPNSRLPQQHFDHAKPRSVENGVALVRSCNTGVTGAVDCLGRELGVVGEEGAAVEWQSDAILLNVPTYHYQTLYSIFGDKLILGICTLLLALNLILKKMRLA